MTSYNSELNFGNKKINKTKYYLKIEFNYSVIGDLDLKITIKEAFIIFISTSHFCLFPLNLADHTSVSDENTCDETMFITLIKIRGRCLQQKELVSLLVFVKITQEVARDKKE